MTDSTQNNVTDTPASDSTASSIVKWFNNRSDDSFVTTFEMTQDIFVRHHLRFC